MSVQVFSHVSVNTIDQASSRVREDKTANTYKVIVDEPTGPYLTVVDIYPFHSEHPE